MAKKYEAILVDVSGPVAHVKINRPEVLNALNLQVLEELTSCVNELTSVGSCRVLVLSGAGEKAFIAGADIAQMQGLSSEQAHEFARFGQLLTQLLEAAPFATIAKVHGYALGGGCELAMACDLIIATEDSIFGQPEVNLGLIPGFGGTQRLTKRVGQSMAQAILIAGKQLKGEESLRAGLASYVTTRENLETQTQAVIKNILRAGPNAIAQTKRLCQRSWDIPLEQGLSAEASTFGTILNSPEAREGMSAFIEKRKPSFSTSV
ncbi:MAG: enoyl-CoA hydratase/isomerase family protein [Oligoflexales bacterium]